MVFKEPVYDGKVISPRHVALRNEANLFALANLEGELLTDYAFTVLSGSNRDWFSATVKVEGANNYTQLLDQNGKVLLDRKKSISIRPNGLLIVREKGKEFILDDQFEVLYEAGEREINALDSLYFVVGPRDSVTILDLNMQEQVEPIYSYIGKTVEGKTFFMRAGYSGFFDESWSEELAVPFLIEPNSRRDSTSAYRISDF